MTTEAEISVPHSSTSLLSKVSDFAAVSSVLTGSVEDALNTSLQIQRLNFIYNNLCQALVAFKRPPCNVRTKQYVIAL